MQGQQDMGVAEDLCSRNDEPLQSYRVGPLPTIFYIPDFVSFEEQSHLLQQVYGAPVSKWKTLKNRRLQNWGGMVHEKGLLSQALPSWLSALTEKIYKVSGLFPSPLNHVLVNEYLPGQGIMPHQDGPAYFPVVAILSLGSPAVMRFTPHARLGTTANRSISPDPGNQEDTIAFKLHAKTIEAISVVLMPGSLLIFNDSAYQDYLHGIDECFEHKLDDTVVNLKCVESPQIEDASPEVVEISCSEHVRGIEVLPYSCSNSLTRNGTRVSLTCRLVARVHRNLIRL